MSVQFHSPEGSLDISNGAASRLLRAIGYSVSEENDGSMPIERAREGIAKARVTLIGEDLNHLNHLEEIVDEVAAEGGTELVWS